jgi:hypothetical protein
MHIPTRLLIALAAVLLLAAPAAASPPQQIAGQPLGISASPATAFTTLLSKTRPAKARRGLGLPPYSKLLGKKWARKVAAADAKLTTSLNPPATGRVRAKDAGTGQIDLPVGIKDKLSGRGGKQSRQLRVASALDTGCPIPDANGDWGIDGRARGEYIVTTVERVGRYDVTTTLVFETRFLVHGPALRTGHIEAPSGRGGTVSVTRNQTARDRRTGKTRKTGPTSRDVEHLDTLLHLDGAFDDFVNANNDDDDAPAPNRPIDRSQLKDAAQEMVAVVYQNLWRDYELADKRMQTPNTCVMLGFDAPARLAPSQAIDLEGKPRLVQGQVTPEKLLEDATVSSAEWVNFKGQTLELTAGSGSFKPGEPWYRFTAPPAAWAEDQPVGVKFTFTSQAGIAEATVVFKPIESTLYFKVVDVHGSVDATGVTNTGGQCVFTGGPQHIDLGPGAAGPVGQLDGTGHVETPIAHTTQAYTTLLDCPGESSDTPCSFATESLPNQHLGINLRDNGDGQVKLSWGFVAVQLGHSGCSLQVPDLYVDQSLLETSVPVSKFQASEPFTVEDSGDQTYSVQQGISTMSGHLRWTFSMTLQRVRADGSPL